MSGALFVLLGEALLSACLPLLCWFAVAGITYAVYIPLSEALVSTQVRRRW
jgi:hypothetical protein